MYSLYFEILSYESNNIEFLFRLDSDGSAASDIPSTIAWEIYDPITQEYRFGGSVHRVDDLTYRITYRGDRDIVNGDGIRVSDVATGEMIAEFEGIMGGYPELPVYDLNNYTSVSADASDNLDRRSALGAQLIRGNDDDNQISASAHGDLIYVGRGGDHVTLGAGSDTVFFRVRTELNSDSGARFWDGLISTTTIDRFEVGVDRFVIVDISQRTTVAVNDQSSIFDSLGLVFSGGSTPSISTAGFPNNVLEFSSLSSGNFPLTGGFGALETFFGAGNIRIVGAPDIPAGIIANNAPQLTGHQDYTLTVPDETHISIDLRPFFIDIDGNDLTYIMGFLPDWLTYDNMHTISGYANNPVETYFTVGVSDGISDTQTIQFFDINFVPIAYLPYRADEFETVDLSTGASGDLRNARTAQLIQGTRESDTIYTSGQGDVVVPGGENDIVFMSAAAESIIVRVDSNQSEAARFIDFSGAWIGPKYSNDSSLLVEPGTPEYVDFYFEPEVDRIVIVDLAARAPIDEAAQQEHFDMLGLQVYYNVNARTILFTTPTGNNFTIAHSGAELTLDDAFVEIPWTMLTDFFEPENFRVVAPSQIGTGVLPNLSPSGTVTIVDDDGILQVGNTLTVTHDIYDSDGLGNITYRWYHASDTARETVLETDDSYTLDFDDIGEQFVVTAAYTDLNLTDELVISAPSAPLALLPLNADFYRRESAFFNAVEQSVPHFLTAGATNYSELIIASAHGDLIFGGTGTDTVLFGAGADIFVVRVDSSLVDAEQPDLSVFYDSFAPRSTLGDSLTDFGVGTDKIIFVDTGSFSPIEISAQATLFDSFGLSLGPTRRSSNEGFSLQGDEEGIIAYHFDFINLETTPAGADWASLEELFGTGNIRIITPEQLGRDIIPNSVVQGEVLIRMDSERLTGAPEVYATLTLDTGGVRDPDGVRTFNYAWYDAEDTEYMTPLSTAAQYVVQSEDAGRAFVGIAAYTDGNGHAEQVISAPTAGAILPARPPNLSIAELTAELNLDTGINSHTSSLTIDDINGNDGSYFTVSYNNASGREITRSTSSLDGEVTTKFGTLSFSETAITYTANPHQQEVLALTAENSVSSTIVIHTVDSDNLMSEPNVLNVSIQGTNDAPRAHIPVWNLRAPEYGSTVINIAVQFADPESDEMTFSISDHPEWVYFTGTHIYITPADTSGGVLELQAFAHDGELTSAPLMILIDVEDHASPPRVSTLALPDVMPDIDVITMLTLDPITDYFTDADLDDSLTVSVTIDYQNAGNGWVNYDAETSVITFMPSALNVTTNDIATITLTAVDSTELTASRSFQAVVNTFDDPPIFDVARSRTTFIFNGEVSQYGRTPSGELFFSDDRTHFPDLIFRVDETVISNSNSQILGNYGMLTIHRSDDDGVLTWEYTRNADVVLEMTEINESFIVYANDGIHNSIEVPITIEINATENTEFVYVDVPQTALSTPIFSANTGLVSSVITGTAVNDVIVSNGLGSNVIAAGTGIDTVVLTVGETPIADTIIYEIDITDGTWRAQDGADHVRGFERGTDRLLLSAQTHDGAFDFATDYNNNISLALAIENTDVVGVDLRFATSGFLLGRIPAGNSLSIEFAEPLPLAELQALLPDVSELGDSPIVDIVSDTDINILATILGGAQNFETTQTVVAENSAPTGSITTSFIDDDTQLILLEQLDVATEMHITWTPRNLRVGDTIRVDASDISDADGLGAFSYQWVKLDISTGEVLFIENAISADYQFTADDLGDVFRAIASYDDGAGHRENIATSAFGRVLAAPVAPADDGNLNIDGLFDDDVVVFDDFVPLLSDL